MKEINTAQLFNDINEMRNAIHDNLIALMEHYKQRKVYCYESDDCPIVHSGYGDECMTLDSIEVVTTPSEKYIEFSCSGSYNNGYTRPTVMDIELLIEVYDWIMENKEILFENND